MRIVELLWTIIATLLLFLPHAVAAFEWSPEAVRYFEVLAAPIPAIEKYRNARSSWPPDFLALMEFVDSLGHEIELDPDQYCEVVFETLPNDQLRLQLAVVRDSAEGCLWATPLIFSVDADRSVSWVVDIKSLLSEPRDAPNEDVLERRREEARKHVKKQLETLLGAPNQTDKSSNE